MLNNAQIIGYLGKDPEVRYLPSGEAVANFSVATTEKWKDKQTGERKEATEWHRINFFGRTAEVVGQYLKKGSLVYVSGKIKTRKYTDKDGIDRYATEIQGNELKMLGGSASTEHDEPRPEPRRQAATPALTKPSAATGSGFDDLDDDIPF